MSVSVKNYREVRNYRNYLLKVIEKQKQNITSYPVSLFNNKLADDLKKVGFLISIKSHLVEARNLSKNLSLHIRSNPRI